MPRRPETERGTYGDCHEQSALCGGASNWRRVDTLDLRQGVGAGHGTDDVFVRRPNPNLLPRRQYMKPVHSMIRVLDEARSVRFYEAAFGLQVADRFVFEGFTLLYLRNAD